MLNAHQVRALTVLEGLLASHEDDTHEDDTDDVTGDENPPKKGGKKKPMVKFLPSRALALPWLHRQEQWAPDWCEGWYFRPDYAHAKALGVSLKTRKRIAGIYVDEHIKPIQEVDEDGKPLFTKGRENKDGERVGQKPIYKKLFKYHLEWAQSSAFYFRENYIIHMAKNDKWETQQKNTPLSLVIVEAKAAVPGTMTRPRDPGKVTFALCRREGGYKRGEPITMTQDEFMRYLITGEGV